MPSKAKPTKNTLLKRGDGGGGGEVFTTIAEVKSFSGPGEQVSTIDVTSFDSAAKEFISDALPDGKEVTFQVNFIGSDAEQQGLRTDLRAGTLRNFQLLLNDHAATKTTFTFAALVTDLDGPKGGQGEAYTMDVTLKVSGQPTVAYAPA